MSTTRTELSPFAAFLQQEDVRKQLNKNIASLLTQNTLESDSGLSYITRYFNYLPAYSRMKPTLDCLVESITSGNFDAWLKLAVVIAVHDLFDEDGELRKDVARILNYKSTPDAKGILDTLLGLYPKEKVNAFLFCSYLQMYNGNDLLINHPDIGSTDLAKNPLKIYSRLSTEFKDLEFLDKNFIESWQSKLYITTHDANFNCEKIRLLVCNELIHKLEELLNVKQEDETDLHKKAKTVLIHLKKKLNDPASTLAKQNIMTILHAVTSALKDPLEKNHSEACRAISLEIDKLSPGAILKSVAIGVGGFVFVTATALVALASFGFITLPMLAFSQAVGYTASFASVGGAASSTYGITFFSSNATKKSDLAVALEDLANATVELQKQADVNKKLN